MGHKNILSSPLLDFFGLSPFFGILCHLPGQLAGLSSPAMTVSIRHQLSHNFLELVVALQSLMSFVTLCVSFVSFVMGSQKVFDPMDCSTPGFPVLHYVLGFVQTHVNRFNDAIQPSHPLSSPSPPAFNLSQHQSLFQ